MELLPNHKIATSKINLSLKEKKKIIIFFNLYFLNKMGEKSFCVIKYLSIELF